MGLDTNNNQMNETDPAGSGQGGTWSIEEAYITYVSDDGSRVLVSPISQPGGVYEAIQLSPIPTSLSDGRRLQGMPTALNGAGGDGDKCMCVVVNSKYFIIGYYNGEDNKGEKVSLVKGQETIQPFRNGVMFKISDTAYMIARKANWLLTWMDPWSNIDAKGNIPGDGEREGTHTTIWTNIVQRTWGGFNKWLRDKADYPALEAPTTHTSMQGKFHEPDVLSDTDLEPQIRNDNIDNTSSAPGSDAPADNKDNLGYVDKVIKRSGSIGDNTHVYEREVRQSKELDKEKTVFTRLREGHREGVLSEYETIDTLLFTHTGEKRGIFEDGRLTYNSYTQYADDTFTTVTDRMVTQFGNNSVTVYSKVVDIGDESGDNQVSFEIGPDGTVTITTTSDDAKFILNNKLTELGRVGDNETLTEIVRWDGIQAQIAEIVAMIKQHDHNTGVGPSTAASAGVLSPPLFAAYDTALTSTHEPASKSITGKIN